MLPTPRSKARFPGFPRGHDLLFVLLAGALALSAFKGYRTGLGEGGNDLTIYLEGARHILGGRSPMEVEGYIYLPVFAVMIAPLGALPAAAAVFLWQAGSWAAVLWSARCVARLLGSPRETPWLAWFCLLVTYRLADSNLAYGQANGFTLAALLKALELARGGRRDRGALLAGGAAAFKILPGVLLALWGLRGQWRAALLGGLAFALLALGLPLAALGLDLGLEVQGQWFRQVVQPYLLGGEALLAAHAYLPGQSLVAVVYHTFLDTPVSANAPGLRANLVNWAPEQVHTLVRALTLLHGAVFATLVLRSRKRQDRHNLVPQGALALCTVLLVAPIVHRAHMLWILPTVGILARRAWRSDPPHPLQRPGLLCAGALIGLTSSGVLGKETARWLMGHGVIWLAVEILWVTLVCSLWNHPDEPPGLGGRNPGPGLRGPRAGVL